MAELWMFVGAVAVAYLVPGPDMILLLQTGAQRGPAHALATAVGLAAARAAHIALAALGLAALLQTAPLVFDAIRIGGAAYLIWLGLGILRAPLLVPDGSAETGGHQHASHLSAVGRGLLTNLLNPKALLFCSVLLPQFVRPEPGSVGSQFLLLGVVLVAVGLFFDVLLAFAGSSLGRWLARHRRAQFVQRWTFATLLVGFGTRLAIA
jgi:threonine/homoserine/homoserine lactone efflux protein